MLQFDICRFDIYRKIPKDLTQPTRAGAIISIATISFCMFLLVAEFSAYMTPNIVSEVYVDDPVKSYEFIPVFLNITLHTLSCSRVGLDIQDDMGRQEVGFVQNSRKEELPDGVGCRLESSFRIAKVSGNFHVSTHAADESSTGSSSNNDDNTNVNMAHTIHELSFGNSASNQLRNAFNQVSSFTPLDDTTVPPESSDKLESHDYFLKIVPSIFDAIDYRLFPFQFTSLYRKVSKENALTPGNPVIWFRYEMAPIVVKYKEQHKPFYHFLTQVCAIVGGSFTVSGIIDSLVFSASQVFVKARLGKLP